MSSPLTHSTQTTPDRWNNLFNYSSNYDGKRKEIHRKLLKDKEAGQRPLKTMKWAGCKMSGDGKNSAREVGGGVAVVGGKAGA